jgi:hypothetical protein
MRSLSFLDWGPKLRYVTDGLALDKFNDQLPRDLPAFLLYGSGDFHHLTGLFLKRATAALKPGEDVTLVTFDNHPDWDVRPPRWSCGGWINRALDLSGVRQVHVWGCGNFELKFPARLFANRAALASGRLTVHPWAERYGQSVCRRYDCMSHDIWRYGFDRFTLGLMRQNVYISVDLDCLTDAEAKTNWEGGLFAATDVAWAIGQLRARANVIGGDLCGAFSPARCVGAFRRFAAWWDHPRLRLPALEEARSVNAAALRTLWPALAAKTPGSDNG